MEDYVFCISAERIKLKTRIDKKAIKLMDLTNDIIEVNTDLGIDVEVHSFLNMVKQSYFFSGMISGYKVTSNCFTKISLNKINFSVRFKSCLKSQTHLDNLKDLLNTDYIQFIMTPKCGEKKYKRCTI